MPVSEIYDNGVLRALTPADLSGGASVPPIMAVIDSATPPKRWVMVTDYRSSPATVTFYEFGTTTVGTPTLPVSPDDDADSATAANQLIGIARLEAIRDRLPASGAATEATLGQVRDRIPSQQIAGLMPVDTLATPGTARIRATSSAAASVALTATCRRISMYATQDAYYSISGTATSSSHFIAAGERLDFDVPANTSISALRVTTDGVIYITELV